MKYKYLLILFTILVLPSITAIETLGTFQVNDCVELIQICNNCTFNNVTSVLYPNSSTAESDLIMTVQGTRYNHTFCNNSAIGNYIVNGVGDLDGVNTVWNYDYLITRTGAELTTGESIIYIIFLVAITFIFLLCFYGFLKLPFHNQRNEDGRVIGVNELKHLKVFLFFISYLLLMFIFGITKSITENYLFLNGANEVFNWLYWIMFAFLFPILVLGVLFTILGILTDKKINDAIRRGVPTR